MALNGMMLRAAARDGDDDDDEEQANFLPKEFVCPITQELLEDPVIAEDGFSYERIAMERWFSTGKTRSPVTSERMEGRSLTPNKVMKAMIQNYRRELGTRLLQSCNALTSESAAADGGGSSSSSSSSSSSGSSGSTSPASHEPPPPPLTTRTLAAFQEGGADLNVRDGDGNTPLLLLLQAGQLKLAEDLLAFNARASQRNDLGTAPLDLCQSIRSERLARDGGGGDGSAADALSGSGSTGLRVSVKEWDGMIALLEARTTREALEDEEREKIRHGNQMRQRQRQADLDQAERDAANGIQQGDGANMPADIGPGLGFFPSLFALQFQTAAVTSPLDRARADINVGPAEVRKLQVVDMTMKLLIALLVLFLILI